MSENCVGGVIALSSSLLLGSAGGAGAEYTAGTDVEYDATAAKESSCVACVDGGVLEGAPSGEGKLGYASGAGVLA